MPIDQNREYGFSWALRTLKCSFVLSFLIAFVCRWCNRWKWLFVLTNKSWRVCCTKISNEWYLTLFNQWNNYWIIKQRGHFGNQGFLHEEFADVTILHSRFVQPRISHWCLCTLVRNWYWWINPQYLGFSNPKRGGRMEFENPKKMRIFPCPNPQKIRILVWFCIVKCNFFESLEGKKGCERFS